MPAAGRILALLFLCFAPTPALSRCAPAPALAQAPTFQQISGYIEGGLEALARGDTAEYLAGTGRAFAVAPGVPPVAYHHARALALSGEPDSARTLLDRLASQGAVAVFDAAGDSAFTHLAASPGWAGIARKIERARRPISNSAPAFELPERDLTAEGTGWDPKTRTLFLSSMYKRKIVAIPPDGAARDFIAGGQDRIGPVVGLEVDPVRRGLWAASMVLLESNIPVADTTLAAHGLLFHYDVDTGRLRRRYVLPPAGGVRHGFNDLTVLPNGDVYLTDSPAGAIYMLPAGGDGLVEVIPPSTYAFPNGITRSQDGRRLFVAHGGGIDRIEIATRTRTRLLAPDSLNLGGIDGLAFYRNSLIAHQPSWFQRVVRLRLDRTEERVASWETIERHHPRFVQPTTGEIAGDIYYYIANAQLRRFRDGKIFPWDSLDPVLVLKADLAGGAAKSAPRNPAFCQDDGAPSFASCSKAREAMRGAIERGAAPGASAAVVVDGKIVWAEGFGVTDLAKGAPVTSATRFGVGSISKTLTLTAALALADEGKLDLDAPVERYLSDFPHRGRGVTIRRIGAHQSGIADQFADRNYYTTAHFSVLDRAYRGIAAAPLAFTPGTRTEYATGLFTIVGRALERVGGGSYLEVMRRRVFEPAGMSATAPNDPRRPLAGRAAFYVRREDGGFEPAPAFDPSFKLPGAGFLSTAEDLARFGIALLRPGLLSDGARRELFAPVPLADGTPTRYALGFQALEEDGRRVLLQSGGGPGIASWLAVYPDDGVVVAILSNATDAPLGDAVRRAVADAFLTLPAPGPPPRPAPARRPS
jgi:serine beta-lactamase-like protein LACTB, mitochondrial